MSPVATGGLSLLLQREKSICLPRVLIGYCFEFHKTKRVTKKEVRLPGWRTKRFLMEAFRDLSLVDRDFAAVMVPIFKELMFYKGIIVRDMAMSALVRLEKQYANDPIPQIEFLSKFNVVSENQEQQR